MKKPFRSIRRLIRNIKLWYPILKEDENWDYVYFYEVMKHKLELMEKLHRNEGHATDSEVFANEMRLSIEGLERLIEDDYDCEEAKEYYEKLSFDELINKDRKSDKDIIRWMEYENEQRNKDRDFVFNYMRDHVERWWD